MGIETKLGDVKGGVTEAGRFVAEHWREPMIWKPLAGTALALGSLDLLAYGLVELSFLIPNYINQLQYSKRLAAQPVLSFLNSTAYMHTLTASVLKMSIGVYAGYFGLKMFFKGLEELGDFLSRPRTAEDVRQELLSQIEGPKSKGESETK